MVTVKLTTYVVRLIPLDASVGRSETVFTLYKHYPVADAVSCNNRSFCIFYATDYLHSRGLGGNSILFNGFRTLQKGKYQRQE